MNGKDTTIAVKAMATITTSEGASWDDNTLTLNAANDVERASYFQNYDAKLLERIRQIKNAQ